MDSTPPLERPIRKNRLETGTTADENYGGKNNRNTGGRSQRTTRNQPLGVLDENTVNAAGGPSVKSQYGRRRRADAPTSSASKGVGEDRNTNVTTKSESKTHDEDTKVRVSSSKPLRVFSNRSAHWHESRPAQKNHYGKKQSNKSKTAGSSGTVKSVVGMEGLSSLLESEENGKGENKDSDEEHEDENEEQQDQMTPLFEHRTNDRTSLGASSTTSENSAHSNGSDVAEGLQFTEEAHHQQGEAHDQVEGKQETKPEEPSSHRKINHAGHATTQFTDNKNGRARQGLSKKFSVAQQKRSSMAKFNRMSLKTARAPSMNQMRRVSVGSSAYALPGLANKHIKPPTNKPKIFEKAEEAKSSSSLKERLSTMGAVKLPGLDLKQEQSKGSITKAQLHKSNDSLPEQEAEAVSETSTPPRRQLSKGELLKAFEFVLEFLDSYHLMHVTPQVCKDWNRISRTLYSWRAAETRHHSSANTKDKPVVPLNTNWYPFLKAFPWGRYLTAGGFKEVYEVWCAALRRMEAVAIMDVETLCAVDNFEMVKAEVQTSCLLSELVRTGKCPHYVEVYQVFPHQYHIPDTWWGNEEKSNPWSIPAGEYSGVYIQHSDKITNAIENIEGRGTGLADNEYAVSVPNTPCADEASHYQYIRMELCAQGDMEEFLRLEDSEYEDISYSAQDALSYVFQMAFSLFVAQKEVGLCHYDIKLLNFLLRPASEMIDSSNTESSYVYLRYRVEGNKYEIPLPLAHDSKRSNLVKLADFGTADCDAESLGKSIQSHHFTTFENVPPEFLIYGDASTQGFHNDMWNLGLCMLHCFTGAMPYEEILDEVQAPEDFIKELEDLWKDKAKLGEKRLSRARKCKQNSSDRSSLYPEEINATFEDVTFLALGEALKSDDEHMLAHTLWRFVVLLGFPGTEEAAHKEYPPGFVNSPVWKLLRKYICPESDLSSTAKPTRRKKKSNSAVQRCAERYMYDSQRFSIVKGNHPLMQKLRTRLREISEGESLLNGLLTYSACNRLNGRDVVLHPAFQYYGASPEKDATENDCSVEIISS